MLLSVMRGQTSFIVRMKILDSTVSTGAGKTGLAYNTTGLKISTIADNESTAIAYVSSGGEIEDIATPGTYVAPSANKCRFRELSPGHLGVYELQFANARFAVSNAKYLLISISGVTGAAEADAIIPLWDFNPYADVASTIWSAVLDGTRTATQLMRGFAAALLGKSSGHTSGASTPKYRDIANSKNVIDAVTDADGNRTSVTLDLS